MVRRPVPKPSYLDQCDYLGFVHGDRRWRSKNGNRLFTWDELHGEIEVFNVRGRHLGSLDPAGSLIKEAVPGRWVDV
ncbi:MAG: hypothetical protein EXR07_00685 [Acetobacteraceae bacterium]|nr:hypothetical protein [Acetobacteraceae bacterium]